MLAARLVSNAEDIDVFFNGVNSHHLPKGTVRGLIPAHEAYHVLQIIQHMKREYAKLEETWSMMRQHVYVIADTLTMALVKQFPGKFVSDVVACVDSEGRTQSGRRPV